MTENQLRVHLLLNRVTDIEISLPFIGIIFTDVGFRVQNPIIFISTKLNIQSNFLFFVLRAHDA
jgi:hypothetical protein